PRPSLGAVLSCTRVPFRATDGRRSEGDARLYRILITESAYLIWKLRNERVICEEGNPATPASRTEIESRWRRAINDRLATDCKMTNARKYGTKALQRALVEQTWKGTLQNEDKLPPDW
ncbi:hypothetical protein WOLCODRAFT_51472, partial [Wolfiporia cocos MD-104 SS10]